MPTLPLNYCERGFKFVGVDCFPTQYSVHYLITKIWIFGLILKFHSNILETSRARNYIEHNNQHVTNLLYRVASNFTTINCIEFSNPGDDLSVVEYLYLRAHPKRLRTARRTPQKSTTLLVLY